MSKTTWKRFLGICIALLTACSVSLAFAARVKGPVVSHNAPSVVQSSNVQFSITVTDSQELLYVGFGVETSPLSDIKMQVVSPGQFIATMQENLTLKAGLNNYIVVAQDVAGYVTKTAIAITNLQTVTDTNLIGSVSFFVFDAWAVGFTNGDTVTVTGPRYTLLLGTQNYNVIGCIGSSGSLSLPATAFGGPNSSFFVGLSGQYTGPLNYTVNVSVAGSTPAVSAAYVVVQGITLNDIPNVSLSLLGITSTSYVGCN